MNRIEAGDIIHSIHEMTDQVKKNDYDEDKIVNLVLDIFLAHQSKDISDKNNFIGAIHELESSLNLLSKKTQKVTQAITALTSIEKDKQLSENLISDIAKNLPARTSKELDGQ